VVVWLTALRVFGRFQGVGELLIGACAISILRVAQDSSWIVLAAVLAIASIAALRPSIARQVVALWGAAVAIGSAGIVGFSELEGLVMLAGAWLAILSVAVRSEWSIARGLAWSGPPLLALVATPRLAELVPGWTVVPALAGWAAALAWGRRAAAGAGRSACRNEIVAGLVAPTHSSARLGRARFALGRHFHSALRSLRSPAPRCPGDPLLARAAASTPSCASSSAAAVWTCSPAPLALTSRSASCAIVGRGPVAYAVGPRAHSSGAPSAARSTATGPPSSAPGRHPPAAFATGSTTRTRTSR
jgi:hypothetical protein